MFFKHLTNIKMSSLHQSEALKTIELFKNRLSLIHSDALLTEGISEKTNKKFANAHNNLTKIFLAFAGKKESNYPEYTPIKKNTLSKVSKDLILNALIAITKDFGVLKESTKGKSFRFIDYKGDKKELKTTEKALITKCLKDMSSLIEGFEK